MGCVIKKVRFERRDALAQDHNRLPLQRKARPPHRRGAETYCLAELPVIGHAASTATRVLDMIANAEILSAGMVA
jgi:hypothetical protein